MWGAPVPGTGSGALAEWKRVLDYDSHAPSLEGRRNRRNRGCLGEKKEGEPHYGSRARMALQKATARERGDGQIHKLS